MRQSVGVSFDPGKLVVASETVFAGTDPRRDRLPDGRRAWTSVRRGVLHPTPEWDELTAADRHLALVHATLLMCRDDVLLSHHSAAAVWGLPVIGPWPTRVHVTHDGSGGSTGLLSRHRLVDVPEGVWRDGAFVTTPARTVVDLSRCVPLACAVTVADAALARHLCTLEELCDEVTSLPQRSRGRARASLVTELADHRSESPGESLSRARMFELRLPRPQLQAVVHDEAGFVGRCDFEWEDRQIVGEFDGRVKYGRAYHERPDDAAEALWQEKRREDRLRRVRAGVARWTWGDALDGQRLLSILRCVGLVPQPRRRWL